MSLAIEIGSLAFQISEGDEGSIQSMREDFENLNSVLSELGLPTHNEPEHLPETDSRAKTQSFSYSTIHHLRRAYAYHLDSPEDPIEYIDEDEDPSEDIILDLELDNMRSHLIAHSDTEGFYVPVDFTQVVIDPTDQDRILGQYLGSSFQLQRELQEISPKLGIGLVEGKLLDSEADSINQCVSNDGPFSNEKLAWIALWEASRLSLEHGTAIVFC